MKRAIALSVLVLAAGCGGVTAKSTVDQNAKAYPPNIGNICMLAGSPPADVQYEVLGRVVATKRSYGSSAELFPSMALEAREIGADAIINVQASQRFKGPLPWRVTSPTGDGQAIRVLPESPKLDCLQAGGKVWGPDGREVMSTARRVDSDDAMQSSESMDGEVANSDDNAARPDLHAELMKLDDLRNKGLLTDAEFESEKTKLLANN